MIEQHNTVIVINARMASASLPGRPMADINGVPMIVEVWKRAVAANIGHVLVAASENQIADAIRNVGGDAMTTEAKLYRGPGQIAAALSLRDSALRFQYVLALPDNMPTIDALTMRRCLAALSNDSVEIATIAALITDETDKNNPHIVKAITPLDGGREVAYARGFVRQVSADMKAPFWRHCEVYAYRRTALAKFAALPASAPEHDDRPTDAMRAVAHDMKVAVVKVDWVPLAVDNSNDLENARRQLKDQK